MQSQEKNWECTGVCLHLGLQILLLLTQVGALPCLGFILHAQGKVEDLQSQL